MSAAGRHVLNLHGKSPLAPSTVCPVTSSAPRRIPTSLLVVVLSCILIAGCARRPALDAPVDWRSMGITRIPDRHEYPDDPAVILLDEGRAEIIGSGEVTSTLFERHRVVTILNAGGHRFANIAIAYGTGSTVDQIEARTVTPDGKVHPLGENDIYDVSLYPNFVFYSDQRAKIFTFPAVEDGSLLEYRYQVRVGGGNFWNSWEFQSTVPTLLSRFTLVRPAEWHVDARQYGISIEPREVKVPSGFKATTVWEAQNVPALPVEPGMPPARDMVARLAIAPLGFREWNDVARWYDRLSSQRRKAGPSVRELAARVTADATTDREKLRRLFEWVQQRVRYMAVEIGMGGYQPHAAEDVCHRLYGDCKDMTTLLCSLAGEAGIDVHPVLISTWQNGIPDTTLPSPLHFNHAIAYWQGDEKGGVWMDATEKGSSFGELPWYDQGAVVLVVNQGGKPLLLRTPRSTPVENASKEVWDVAMDSSGSATVQGSMELTAVPATEVRGDLYDASPRERRTWLEALLVHRVPGLTIDSLHIDGLSPMHNPLRILYRFHTRMFATPHTGEMIVRPASFGANSLSEMFRPVHRQQPIRFRYGMTSSFSMSLRLPEGWSTTIPPIADSLVSAYGHATWQYQPAQHGLVFRSSLQLSGDDVPSASYDGFQAFLDGVKAQELREVVTRKVPQ